MIKKEHDCFEADNRTGRHKMRSVQARLDVGLRLTKSAGNSLLGQGRLSSILTEKISALSFLSQKSKLQAAVTAGDIHSHLYTWINIKVYSNGMMEWECVKWIHLAQTSNYK